MDNKHCPECGKALFGRVDKRFCSDICRHSNNNRQRTLNGVVINNINSILRRNRSILASLNPIEPIEVRKEKLYDKGFNFSYITSVDFNTEGGVRFYCYEYGYFVKEENLIYVVRKEE
jgi:predicted nucleic acid-binding Zn ribbon protein